MNQELVNAIFLVLASVLGGVVVGGATALVIYDRAVKSILASPVIIESLHGAFASLPAPVQQDVKDTVALADQIVATPAPNAPAPAVSTGATVSVG